MKPLHNADKIFRHLTEIKQLFDFQTGVKTIGEFVEEVDRLSSKYKDSIDDPEGNSFKGDMFEIIGEIFFGLFSTDPKVGITDFIPVPLAEDYGVDGIGTNVNGDKCAIQFKYRSNPLEAIDLDSMSKTFGAGICLHNLPLINNDTLWLFTTGGGATDPCHKVYGKKLRVIYRDIIAGRIDNNMTFWKEVQERIGATLDYYSSK